MNPREFVGRVIDLFDFKMSGWTDMKPKNFQASAICIRLGEGLTPLQGDNHRTGHSKKAANYAFELEADESLGHTIIRASMIGKVTVRASISFVLEDTGLVIVVEEPDETIFESWQVPININECSDEVVSMLAFLVLKTNYLVKSKTSN